MNKTISFIVATTFATQMTFADIGGASKGSSNSIANASKTSSEIVAGVVIKAGGSIMMLSEKSSASIAALAQNVSDVTSNVSKASFNSAKGISVKAIGMSEKSVTMVLDFSKAHPVSAIVSSVVVSAVTAGGGLIPALLTPFGDGLIVSVKASSTAVTTVLDASSKVIVGTVKWASNVSVQSGKFVLNAAGELLDASGKVVGWVLDASGNVIKLSVNGSGKIATVLGDGSEVIITGSTDALKSTAAAISDVATKTGSLISDGFEASMKVSKMGSLVIVDVTDKVSGASVGSVRFISQTLTNLFDSIASKQSND